MTVLWPGAFLHAGELPPDLASPQNIASASAEVMTPGVDNAVQKAQDEIRDPFARDESFEAAVPSATMAAAPEILTELQGIGFGSKDAYAVIGGEIFYEGDEKKGIKLLEVRRREVDILMSGGKVTLLLFPDDDLRRVKDRAEKKKAVKKASEEHSPGTPSSPSEREQPPL